MGQGEAHPRNRRRWIPVLLGAAAALAAILTLAIARAVEREKIGRCERLVDTLSLAIKSYEFDMNRYPPSGIDRLAQALGVPVEELVDPWGRPFVYRNSLSGPAQGPTIRFTGAFELYSAGPNGIDENGVGDDITDGGWGGFENG